MLKRAARKLFRSAYRLLLPANAKNTLRQWILLDEPDKPVEVIQDFSVGPILVLAPHMDDEVIGCGGALCKHVQAGLKIKIVFLTDGRRGNPDIYEDPSLSTEAIRAAEDQLVRNRKDESTRACKVMGIDDLVFLDGPDSSLHPTPEIVDRLAKIIADLRPTLVYVPTLLDTHADHWSTNRIFYQAVRSLDFKITSGIICREYEVWSPLKANRLVHLNGVAEIKRKALEQFDTQLERFDLMHVAFGLNSYRSMYPFKGVGYAEAYHETPLASYCELYERFSARQ